MTLRLRLKLAALVLAVLLPVFAIAFVAMSAAARAAGVPRFQALLAGDLVLLGLLGLLLLSVFVRTTTVEGRSVLLRAPIDLVFAVTSTPDGAARWTDEVRSIEPLSGRPGQTGSVYRLHFRNGARMTTEVLAVEPPHRMVTRSRLARSTFDVERTCEAVPEGTVIHVRQVRHLSVAARVSIRVQAARLRRKVRELDARMIADIERAAAEREPAADTVGRG
jgi:uncharacterized protein YndB with AHSA1/START domain